MSCRCSISLSAVANTLLHRSAIPSLQCSPNTSFSPGLGLRQDNGSSSERETAFDHFKGWTFATRSGSWVRRLLFNPSSLKSFLLSQALSFPSPRDSFCLRLQDFEAIFRLSQGIWRRGYFRLNKTCPCHPQPAPCRRHSARNGRPVPSYR